MEYRWIQESHSLEKETAGVSSAQTSHFTDITDAWSMFTNDSPGASGVDCVSPQPELSVVCLWGIPKCEHWVEGSG